MTGQRRPEQEKLSREVTSRTITIQELANRMSDAASTSSS